MWRLTANSRATTSSTAIFLSQQSRQYFSSPRGSDTSFAPHNAQRDFTTAFRDIYLTILQPQASSLKPSPRPQAPSRVRLKLAACGLRLSSVRRPARPSRFDDDRGADADRLIGNRHP